MVQPGVWRGWRVLQGGSHAINFRSGRNTCAGYRGRAIQQDGGIHEDESCGNSGFGVGPFQHRRPDFLQEIRKRQNRRSKLAGQPAAEQRVERNPDRNAYFGEEHIHTSWSVDAWLMGNRLTGPDDALKYAQGQTIKHPLGYDIKIDTPMDFMGVTDHSEYVGVTKEANTPGSALSKLPAGTAPYSQGPQ